MRQLLLRSAAYKILKGDAMSSRLSHAYMLYFADEANLRSALKLFAEVYFPADKPALIQGEGLTDLKIYPKVGAKLTAEAAGDIVDDSAIRPVLHDKKLYVISDFDTASPIFQNKLLKVLEEPPVGVYFLLGVTSLSPVLVTVKSRVKLLEIPPLSEEGIYAALERAGHSDKNLNAAQNCGGVLGVAQSMLHGEWYAEVSAAANELAACTDVSCGTMAAVKYADFKYKKELLAQLQRIYFNILKRYAKDEEFTSPVTKRTAAYAVERIDEALADLKFNANFGGLLFNLMLAIVGAD